MPCIIVLGAQWGDEGKGKIIDLLASNAQHIVRAQGGNNAGHTVIANGQEYKLHLIPSGILHPHAQCYIGAGTVIDPEILGAEIASLKERGIEMQGRLWISPLAHVIFSFHREIDFLKEKVKASASIGTTGRGIGPCYTDKSSRVGIRIGELIRPDLLPEKLRLLLREKEEEFKSAPLDYEVLLKHYSMLALKLKPFVADIGDKIQHALSSDENILLEGAQGTFLDLSFGTYPYVTSSHTIAAGICLGAGVGPSHISHTIGVFKAYATRVGNGPFPTETTVSLFLDPRQAREFGTTTGRQRRIGWFDAVLAKTAVQLNGLQSIALTKLDILDDLDQIQICTGYTCQGKILSSAPSLTEDLATVTPIYEILSGWKTPTSSTTHYEDLPKNAKNYIRRIEELCGIPIVIVSLGAEREKTIVRKNPFEERNT